MTFYHGLGMFLFNMIAFFIGIIIAYYIINKVEEERKMIVDVEAIAQTNNYSVETH